MNTILLSELLGGTARYRALRCLYEHADREFATRELAAAAGIDPGNASRWLRRWAQVGLLEQREQRGGNVYRASRDPALEPLKLLLQQDSETAQVLKRYLEPIEAQVEAAAIFGSAASGDTHEASDVDLLLLTRLPRLEAQASFKAAGRELKRPVNVLTFTPEAWASAKKGGDALVADIRKKPLVLLKGTLDAQKT